MYLPYTGIGSRKTPPEIIKLMEELSMQLAVLGFTLRSGGADGADTAFEVGANCVGGKKEIYLPWVGFNENESKLCHPPPIAYGLAKRVHPNWGDLSRAGQSLMARNGQQVLGEYLDSVTNFIAYWTPGGRLKGGTAQALRLAHENDVKTFFINGRQSIDDVVQYASDIKIFKELT